ncbi:MAG TPA: protein phosphatase 2C domain-containing protein, partial [Gemmataceae bacterium]|nr:protein phosphatase 2C domain-containing protein [Gemmataceae bacterium]
IEHASLTDVGVRRSHNQDSHAILLATDQHQWQTRGHVFLVADGMGAHAVGELASELAVGIIPHTYDKHAGQGTAAALRKAFVEANASIHARGQQNREFEGMGTTATALVLRPDGAWVAHVGDSRAYRVRDGIIEQLSFDHSMVWEYARRQKIDPDEVQGIPSNVIFRSLGPEPLVPIDIEGVHPIRSGDVYVLCSDGLSGQIGDTEIGAIVGALPPAEACRFLIDLANLRGGPDNITVIVVRVGGEMATTPPPTRSWHERVPWPLPALFFGALLTGGAIMLALDQLMTVAVFVFRLAAVTIGGGLGGLFVYHSREKRRLAEEADRPRPKIHRSQSCSLDTAVLEKFQRSAQALKALAREKEWPGDFDTFDSLYDAAETHLSRHDLAAAFRDLGRAMQALLRGMGGPGGKTEVFSPRWDSEAVKRAPSHRQGNGHEPPAFRCDNCGKVSPQPPGKVTPMCCERPMKKM